MPRAVLLVVAMGALGFAPAPFLAPSPKALAQADLKDLQGLWVSTHSSQGGAEVRSEEGFRDFEDVYHGHGFVKCHKGKKYVEGEFALDITTQPRRILFDFVISGKRCRDCYIYRLDGDTLTICHYNCPEKASRTYPADFTPCEEVTVVVLERKKP